MQGKWSQLVRMMLVAQCLALLTAGIGIGAELPGKWTLVDADSATSDFYYDKSAVTRSPEGVLAIRVKTVYGAEGKADALRVLGSERYAGLAATVYEYELDCTRLSSHLKTVTHFNDKGEKISGFDLAGKTAWEKIPLYSRLDLLQVEVCE